MFRNLFSVLGGLFSAFVVVLVLEKLLPLIFQVSAFDDSKGLDAFNEYLKNLPIGLLAANAASYGIAAFVGCYLTIIISHQLDMGFIVGFLFILIVFVNALVYHHPGWIIAISCISTILGAVLGGKTGYKPI